MNNIKIRKITSLTIMTIMVAGGLTVATPSFMPEAAAQSNSHLYVSASEYGGNLGVHKSSKLSSVIQNILALN